MMGFIKDILDDMANNHTATNVTALKINVEEAQAALKKMEQLADEIEKAYMSENGNIRRCWQCCVAGLEGESKEVMREAVDECRDQYRQIYTGIRTSLEQTTRYLNALIEADAGLADAIRNA